MQKPEVPFFVRFLEAQETLQVRTDVKAGRPPGGGGGPPMVTMKYPSDDDEGGVSI
jgi:serine endopeptidase inhibitor I10-like protein